MPAIKKIEPINKKYKFAVEYKCECGCIVKYYDYDRPERLIKCFNCLDKILDK